MRKPMDTDSTLSVFEKILHLSRSQTSGASNVLSAGQLSVVADQMRERAFKAGSVILREGEPAIAAYSLVSGDVRVSRRGHPLGQVGPGATLGFGGIISRDALGFGAVAATDVLALELDGETLLDIFDDHFAFLLDVIKESARRHLDVIRRLKEFPGGLTTLRSEPLVTGRMNLVERLLFLRTAGGPFERSSVDALAEVARSAAFRSLQPGNALWAEGASAATLCLVVRGSMTCTTSRDDGPVQFRAGPGVTIGALESMAGQPRWHDAVAGASTDVLELQVNDIIDVFEDNTDMATDYLAWVSSTALNLIEAIYEPGAELLDFFSGSDATERTSP
jgi:CRP-like cAMP-binding protein